MQTRSRSFSTAKRTRRSWRRNKFRHAVRIADLERRNEANRRADRRYRARVAQTGSELPSGSTSYRRLPDYELELKLLAERHPDLVKPIVLPHRSHLGRDVLGIEIATDPYNIWDGKPIFLDMGVHHAREWPSSEHSIEWAYGPKEAWQLTCEDEEGRVRSTRDLIVDRGERVNVGRVCSAAAIAAAKKQ